jgi:hypothetical protein
VITAFSRVVTAIVGALQAEPPVCDAEAIYRARPNVIPDQVGQAINVQWENALPSNGAINGAPVDWSTRISVECFARGTSDSGDLLVDPLLEAVYARLAQDSTLGGLVDQLECVGLEAENTSEGKKTGWVRLTYIAHHRTANLTVT